MSGLPTIACPVCLSEYGLEVALGQDDARGVIRELARCPGDAATRKALLRYCALHAPTSQRLRWNRVEAILAEINGWMETARITRDGRVWAAPPSIYLAAIEIIEAMPTLRRPLKGHGLLLEVLSGMCSKTEAAAERAQHNRAAGNTPIGTSAAHREFDPVGRKSGVIAPSATRTKKPAPVSLADTLKSLNLKQE